MVGFDIERHVYGPQRYLGQLVLQDVLTLHGSQFRDAACIVASPPCQDYSYMAMPWSRAKREISWQLWEQESPFGNFHLNDLFDACFRIQREASEAAGWQIPLVVENVKGAQPWVGKAAWHYGSFYLWGDVPALMPSTVRLKGWGGTWFHNAETGRGNPNRDRTAVEGMKGRSNFHNEKTGLPSPSFQGADHEASVQRYQGIKQGGSGAEWFDKALDERRKLAGVKVGSDGFRLGFKNSAAKSVDTGCLEGFSVTPDERKIQHMSRARKAASAQIAKIPFERASYIARVYHSGSELQAVG